MQPVLCAVPLQLGGHKWGFLSSRVSALNPAHKISASACTAFLYQSQLPSLRAKLPRASAPRPLSAAPQPPAVPNLPYLSRALFRPIGGRGPVPSLALSLRCGSSTTQRPRRARPRSTSAWRSERSQNISGTDRPRGQHPPGTGRSISHRVSPRPSPSPRDARGAPGRRGALNGCGTLSRRALPAGLRGTTGHGHSHRFLSPSPLLELPEPPSSSPPARPVLLRLRRTAPEQRFAFGSRTTFLSPPPAVTGSLPGGAGGPTAPGPPRRGGSGRPRPGSPHLRRFAKPRPRLPVRAPPPSPPGPARPPQPDPARPLTPCTARGRRDVPGAARRAVSE